MFLSNERFNNYFNLIFYELRNMLINISHNFFHTQDKIRRPPLDYGPVQNDPRCGLSASRRNVAQRRIVGGSEAGFGTFPWQAYIRIGKHILGT